MILVRPRPLRTPKLRTQLVALLVTLLALAFLLVSTVTTYGLHKFLLQRLDQQLAAAGNRFSVSLEYPNDHDSDNARQFDSVTGQAVGTLGARVLNGKVTAAAVIGHHGDDRATAPGSEARAVLSRLSASSRPRSVDLPDLGDYRVLVSA
jgi:two-component system OmpR family sensor kinase